MTADVFCIGIITNDYRLSVKDNNIIFIIHDACNPILVYSRVNGRKYIYMGLYKYMLSSNIHVKCTWIGLQLTSTKYIFVIIDM